MTRPSHSTVVAYLALFTALGGSAWAVSKIDSKQIENNTIRSADLKNRKAVKTKDVRPNELTGRAVDEASLNASRFLPAGGEQRDTCNPTDSSYIDCAATRVVLPRPGQIVATASGGQWSEGGPARGECEIRIDGVLTSGVPANVGDATEDNTSGNATNGFARTAVTERFGAGSHRVTLACNEGAGDVRISHPTIAAFGISGG